MKINLIPQINSNILKLSKKGDVLSINGEKYDFSSLKDGEYINAADIPNDFIFNRVERVGGEIVLSVIFPYTFSSKNVELEPIIVTKDGNIELPEIA